MPDGIVSKFIIAVDPGTHKCGIALMSGPDDVVWKGIAARDEAIGKVTELKNNYPDSTIVVGGSTQGPEFIRELALKIGVKGELTDEAFTTMDARLLFWRENRPGCFWGIFPPSFRPLPRPIDDYAAVIIGKRYFKVNRNNEGDH